MSFIIKGGGVIINTSMAGNVQQATGGGAIDPATLGENLTLWLDERDQYEVGAQVRWYNQGSRTHLTASDGAGINLKFNETINGYPALNLNQFGGLSPDWNSNPQQPLFSSNSYHIFTVFKYPAAGWSFSGATYGNNAIFSHNNAGFGFFNFRYRFDLSLNLMYSYQQGTGDPYGGDFVYSNDTVVYNTPVLMESWYDGTNLNVRYGDGTVYSAARNPIASGINSYDFLVGRSPAAAITGSLATILVVSYSLDPSTQAGIRQYLGEKYNVAY